MLAIQRGRYVLNSGGHEPTYRFSMYFHRPYSPTLADDYYEIGDVKLRDTYVSEDDLGGPRSILDKDKDYAEIYATVLILKNKNLYAKYSRIKERALELISHLFEEIEKASILISY